MSLLSIRAQQGQTSFQVFSPTRQLFKFLLCLPSNITNINPLSEIFDFKFFCCKLAEYCNLAKTKDDKYQLTTKNRNGHSFQQRHRILELPTQNSIRFHCRKSSVTCLPSQSIHQLLKVTHQRICSPTVTAFCETLLGVPICNALPRLEVGDTYSNSYRKKATQSLSPSRSISRKVPIFHPISSTADQQPQTGTDKKQPPNRPYCPFNQRRRNFYLQDELPLSAKLDGDCLLVDHWSRGSHIIDLSNQMHARQKQKEDGACKEQ